MRTYELAIVAEIPSGLIEAGKWGQGADVKASVTGPNGESAEVGDV